MGSLVIQKQKAVKVRSYSLSGLLAPAGKEGNIEKILWP